METFKENMALWVLRGALLMNIALGCVLLKWAITSTRAFFRL